MTTTAAKTAVQAFICCRLGYCNSMLYGMSDGLLWKVQSIQNAAARLVTGARRYDHITPVLRQLHWLPDVNESTTRLHAWYTSLWLVRHPHTSPTTSHSLRTVIAVSYAQPPPGHASFHGRTTTSAIESSMLQARACGTVYRRTCDET